MEYGIKAEYHRATDILVHEPSDEFFYALLHPRSNDFLAPFDRFRAASEHRIFTRELSGHGIKVHTLSDMLLSDTLDTQGNPQNGQALDRLRGLASESLLYRMESGICDKECRELLAEKTEAIKAYNPRDLVRIVFLRPTQSFRRNGEGLETSLSFEAQGNLCYTRDQQIVTAKGPVIGRLKNDARKLENDIISAAYESVGCKPLYRVTAPGTLEGGDYIPAGSFAMIGEGLRTNKDGIDQLLHRDLFGFDEIVVVEDPLKSMNQMHLDTYFNIIGKDKAIILDVRHKGHLRPKIRQYIRDGDGRYQLQERRSNDFIEFLQKDKGYDIIDIEYNEAKNFSVNVLCLEHQKAIGVNGVVGDFYTGLKSHGVDIKLLDFSNLMLAYGGPHCLTQVLRRDGDGI